MTAPNPTWLIEEFRAFERTLALRTAIEMDLFTRIGAGANTIRALAADAGASERGLRCAVRLPGSSRASVETRRPLPPHVQRGALFGFAGLSGVRREVPRKRRHCVRILPPSAGCRAGSRLHPGIGLGGVRTLHGAARSASSRVCGCRPGSGLRRADSSAGHRGRPRLVGTRYRGAKFLRPYLRAGCTAGFGNSHRKRPPVWSG